MTPTHYSPTIHQTFVGLPEPPTSAFKSPEARMNYFQTFRNERLSRLQVEIMIYIRLSLQNQFVIVK